MELEKNSALFNIAARIAHDIRSPIAAMEIGLQRIEESHLKNDFILVRMAIQRIRDIANNLLEQYRSQVALQPILIKKLLEEVTELKRYEWLEKNCELTLLSHSITEYDQINGDATEIKRMLSNLLNNAIEACDQYANIFIHIHKTLEFIRVEISDNGRGFTAEKIREFLDGKSTKHDGPGLGLLSAKKYIESLKGELLLSSQPGIGTIVTLNFRYVVK